MVENVVKRIPRVNDEERRRYEEEARGQGFIGEKQLESVFQMICRPILLDFS